MKPRFWLLLSLVLATGAAACGGSPAVLIPTSAQPATAAPSRTAPSRTPVQGGAPLNPSPTLPPRPSPTSTSTPTQPVAQDPGPSLPAASASPAPATDTPVPPSTQPALIPCNHASAGVPFDVLTIDDTVMDPGQAFIKTWRLVNTGSCAWSTDYAVVWFSGERFDAPVTNSLAHEVAPGQTVDISLAMRAPAQAGTYQSNWKLASGAGELFGLGPNGNAPFWVRIIVRPSATPTVTPPPPTAEPTLEPVAAGAAVLAPGAAVDLDTNQLNTGPADDLTYQAGEGVEPQLTPLSGARLSASAFLVPPTLEDCQAAEYSEGAQTLASLAPAGFLCYRTNLGLPGRLGYGAPNPATLEITVDLFTWSIP